MSVSELFDHGSPHPWADLRINNLTVDGIIESPNTIFILPISFSGPFLATVFNIIIYKIGRTIVVNFPDIQSSAAGGAIPGDLVPLFIGGLSQYVWPIKVIDNNTVPTTYGELRIRPNGLISIFLDTNETGFQNLTTRGSFSTTISYVSFI
jgi:hypothetical protein